MLIIFPHNIYIATTKRARRDRNGAGTSKQGGGHSAADRCTNRKQSVSTARPQHSSIRRGSQFHEVHIAMLPDLSGKFANLIYNNSGAR